MEFKLFFADTEEISWISDWFLLINTLLVFVGDQQSYCNRTTAQSVSSEGTYFSPAHNPPLQQDTFVQSRTSFALEQKGFPLLLLLMLSCHRWFYLFNLLCLLWVPLTMSEYSLFPFFLLIFLSVVYLFCAAGFVEILEFDTHALGGILVSYLYGIHMSDVCHSYT